MLGWEAVEGVDWSRLFHAYGAASATPGHLRALTGNDPSARDGALEHLYGAVLHQGTIYPATLPAVQVAAGLMRGGTLLAAGDRIRASLLRFLEAAGEGVGWVDGDGDGKALPDPDPAEVDAFFAAIAADEDDGEAWSSPVADVMWARSARDLRDLAPEIVQVLVPLAADPDSEIRSLAVGALARWGSLAGLWAASAAVPALRVALTTAGGRDEYAVLVLALGDLGADVSACLEDDDPAIRALAAMFEPSDRANRILIDALTEPRAVDEWFTNKPARFSFRTRMALLDNLLARDLPFDQILPAATAVVGVSGGRLLANLEWGQILLKAFPGIPFEPGTRPPAPTNLSDAQRTLLRALVSNEQIWNSTDGNSSLALMRVGLPHDRDAVAALADRIARP